MVTSIILLGCIVALVVNDLWYEASIKASEHYRDKRIAAIHRAEAEARSVEEYEMLRDKYFAEIKKGWLV